VDGSNAAERPGQLAGIADARVPDGFSTSLILILLPLKDNQRSSYARELFRAVKMLPIRSTFSGGLPRLLVAMRSSHEWPGRG
jgi:hypothetical protein